MARKQRCPIGDKNRYLDEQEARDDLARIRARSTNPCKPVRAYDCHRCRFWHLTSQPKRVMPRRAA